MKKHLFQPLFLTALALPALTSCLISNGRMDFSPVSDRLEPAEDDDVVLDGDSQSIAAPLAAAPIPEPAPAPAVAPTPENPFVTAEHTAAPKPAATASVDTTKKPAAPAAVGSTYTVQAGDTLNGVARRCGVSPAALAAANGISPTAGLKIGQKLRLPAKGTAAASTAKNATKAAPAAKSGKTRTHTVQAGDTIYRIARQHGVSPAALMQANKLTPQTAGTIKTGTTLTIPAK